MRGDRLKETRLALGHTQESLAELLSVDIRQIWRYENGETEPKADMVARIAQALQVSTDYLLNLTDDPAPRNLSPGRLSPKERIAIAAWRDGKTLEAIKVIIDDSEALGIG